MPKRGRRGSQWRQQRSKSECDGEDDELTSVDLHGFLEEAQSLQLNSQVFDLQQKSDRERLALALWSDSCDLGGMGSLREMNPALSSLLGAITNNSYRQRATHEAAESKNQRHIESILSAFVRIQSQFQMTLLCARFSVAAYRVHLSQAFWRMLHVVAPGFVASIRWTEEFVEFANAFRPKPKYTELKGVGACMFDNYARKVLYSSIATTDSNGYLLKMTNSCSMAVPAELAPPGFDALRCCECCRPNKQNKNAS